MNKIRFPKHQQKSFYEALRSRIYACKDIPSLLARAKKMMVVKLAFYLSLYVSLYFFTLFIAPESTSGFMLSYAMFGLSGILLAFNAAHDSAHGTFPGGKRINRIIFRFTFNINGVNGYLWKKRHIASHHLFPNVDGCDADIDENLLLRLSPSHRKRSIHRFQYLYASFLYMAYTLHWIFYKDFRYLFMKEFSNLKKIRHPKKEIFYFILWKMIYFSVYIFLPMIAGHSIQQVLISFLVMHVIISLVFVWTLIVSHLTMETAFPVQNKEGILPFNFYEHQLATAMDYRPRSIAMNWLVGGFNAHAAHHLFPKWPHTMYRHITFCIQRTAAVYQMPYHSKTFIGALQSHYAYLKVMGR